MIDADYFQKEHEKLQQQSYAPIVTQQGLMGGLLDNALGGWGGTTNADLSQYFQQYATQSMSSPYPIYNQKFHRINKEVSISERDIADGRFEEPLDELRIKVARWLDN